MSELIAIIKALANGEALRPYNDLSQEFFDRRDIEKRERILVLITVLVTGFVYSLFFLAII